MPTEPRSRLPLILMLLGAGGVLLTCVCLGAGGGAYYFLGRKTLEQVIVLDHLSRQEKGKEIEVIEWGPVNRLPAGSVPQFEKDRTLVQLTYRVKGMGPAQKWMFAIENGKVVDSYSEMR